MNNLKKTAAISSYILLTALFFWGGYALGNMRPKETADITREHAIEVNAPIDADIYYLILEEGILSFYSISDGEKTLIASENISENIYPTDDMRDLKNGVMFDNIEDAQALFENFVS